jgi:hypothetical protein
MFVTPFDVLIVMMLSTIAGMLMLEAYYLMEIYEDEDKTL